MDIPFVCTQKPARRAGQTWRAVHYRGDFTPSLCGVEIGSYLSGPEFPQ